MRKFKTLTGDDLMPFGKYKGVLVKDLPENYYNWLRNNTDVDINRDLTDKKRKIKVKKKAKKASIPESSETWESRVLVSIKLTKINKVGNPTVDDWDDYKYTPPKTYYGEVF